MHWNEMQMKSLFIICPVLSKMYDWLRQKVEIRAFISLLLWFKITNKIFYLAFGQQY